MGIKCSLKDFIEKRLETPRDSVSRLRPTSGTAATSIRWRGNLRRDRPRAAGMAIGHRGGGTSRMPWMRAKQSAGVDATGGPGVKGRPWVRLGAWRVAASPTTVDATRYAGVTMSQKKAFRIGPCDRTGARSAMCAQVLWPIMHYGAADGVEDP